MGTDKVYFEKDNLFETLGSMSESKRFNEWLFETISIYCKGKILEIGSGIGNISDFFIKKGFKIYLSDSDERYIHVLQQKFQNSALGISQLDIVANDHPIYNHEFDTVISLNVIEHIENDSLAIDNMMRLLPSGGRLVILVPAFKKLFNQLDKSLLHFRRYDKSDLLKLQPEGSELLTRFYFNSMGIPAWFIGGNVQKLSNIPNSQMKLYDRFVPVWKFLDSAFFHSFGLSQIIVFRKK